MTKDFTSLFMSPSCPLMPAGEALATMAAATCTFSILVLVSMLKDGTMRGHTQPNKTHLIWTTFFFLLFMCAVDGAAIGVVYGRSATTLPSPAQVAQFLAGRTAFDRVKLFDADPTAILVFANTPIAVDVTVPDRLIPSLSDLRLARKWLRSAILPHLPTTNVARILLGNEVLSTANRSLASALLPAMQSLHTALTGLSLQHRIKISAPQSLAVLAASTPPSAGEFRDPGAIRPLLSFLRATDSPFMVNAYPFFGSTADTLDFALFRARVVDEGTGGIYSNMLDAQLDAVFCAMRREGFDELDIVVAETGWPSAGEAWEVGTGAENAREYNGNVVRHVMSGAGTPLMPNRTFEAYVFELFDEDLKAGPASERNFGLFRADLVPVYDIGILRTDEVGGQQATAPLQTLNPTPSLDSKTWCIPKPNAEMLSLQDNIEYVSGQGINCAPIQPGGACYFPDTVAAHAAFLMNEYYQAFGRNTFDCDFGHTGMITAIDPSYGKCIYRS